MLLSGCSAADADLARAGLMRNLWRSARLGCLALNGNLSSAAWSFGCCGSTVCVKNPHMSALSLTESRQLLSPRSWAFLTSHGSGVTWSVAGKSGHLVSCNLCLLAPCCSISIQSMSLPQSSGPQSTMLPCASLVGLGGAQPHSRVSGHVKKISSSREVCCCCSGASKLSACAFGF